MSGNFAIKGGGVGRLMANAILNFHFDFFCTLPLVEELNVDLSDVFVLGLFCIFIIIVILHLLTFVAL